jgi:hypothetical protein
MRVLTWLARRESDSLAETARSVDVPTECNRALQPLRLTVIKWPL